VSKIAFDKENVEVEWAVQYRTNSGGHFDRTIHINGRTNKPYTEEQARQRVEEWNKGRKPEDQARVAYRHATRWKPA
jgi:hypothetical protein